MNNRRRTHTSLPMRRPPEAAPAHSGTPRFVPKSGPGLTCEPITSDDVGISSGYGAHGGKTPLDARSVAMGTTIAGLASRGALYTGGLGDNPADLCAGDLDLARREGEAGFGFGRSSTMEKRDAL